MQCFCRVQYFEDFVVWMQFISGDVDFEIVCIFRSDSDDLQYWWCPYSFSVFVLNVITALIVALLKKKTSCRSICQRHGRTLAKCCGSVSHRRGGVGGDFQRFCGKDP